MIFWHEIEEANQESPILEWRESCEGETSQYFFFCSLLGVLQNFERVCHGCYQWHAITSTNSEGNVERPNRTWNAARVFRRYDGSTGKSVDDLFSSLAQLFKGRLTLTGVKFYSGFLFFLFESIFSDNFLSSLYSTQMQSSNCTKKEKKLICF